MSDHQRGARSAVKKLPRSTLTKIRGEFDLIKQIRDRVGGPVSGLSQGIGDDAAVIHQRSGNDLVVTADLLVEDVDFCLKYTSPHLLGHKALAVSLSDIAAMGARPRWAIVSIGVPRELWQTNFLDEFYEGLLSLAALHDVTLIGGDVSRDPNHLVVDSVVLGEIKRGLSVLRSGAQPGDDIFVTGSLGGASLGLQLLREGKRISNRIRTSASGKQTERLLLRQLAPTARVEFGQMLGNRRMASSMIDISDGLAADLAHICDESNVGASIETQLIPIDDDVSKVVKDQGKRLELALRGGEDFELLFTANPGKLKKLLPLSRDLSITRIGKITNELGVLSITDSDGNPRPLKRKGFDHFRKPN